MLTFHHFLSHPAKEEGIGLGEVLDRVTMRVFVRQHCTMITARVQCDVNGIPEWSHYVLLKLANGLPLSRRAFQRTAPAAGEAGTALMF